MFTIRARTSDLRQEWSRRDLLRVAFGAAAPWLAANCAAPCSAKNAPAAAPPSFGKAKACILIYLYGGPSHVDIWDLKPDAPASIRGDFRPIATNVPGVQITEHLPRLAARADRLAIVRSLTHTSASHGSACHWMLTGYSSRTQGEIAPTPDDYPHPGSVLGRQFAAGSVPPFVALPWQITTQINMIPAQNAGFLGRAHDPVRIQYDDMQGERFQLPQPGALETALRLEREPQATRDRYGRNVFGQSMLLARRLIDAGVRFVTVYWPDRKDDAALHYNGRRQPVSVPMWDTHGAGVGDTANFPSLKNRLLPPLDLASSALLDDLSARGRLDETLLVWTGEFGRTPRIAGDGRGHYSRCFSSMLAGGGVRGGIVHGASDATGEAPACDPVTPGDFLATIYHLLGVPADTQIPDRTGASQRLLAGNVVRGLL
jgi:hypothetical protein